MDFREIVEGSRGSLEKLVGSIPGYKGYKDKNLRRESDKLLRDKIVRELDELQRRLVDQQRNLITPALIQYTDDMERAIMKVQTLRDRIRTAAYGYRGLFDAVKVKEKELDALYGFDAGLLAGVPAMDTAVANVEKAVEGQMEIGQAIDALVRLVRDMNDLFSKREEALYGEASSAATP
jgi:hypothetical protein